MIKQATVYCILAWACSFSYASADAPTNGQEWIITAEKDLAYRKAQGEFPSYPAPEVVAICYQRWPLEHVLEHHTYEQGPGRLRNLYLLGDRRIAVLGGFGIGAPAVAVEIERLIAWGTKKFIAVGMAGTLVDQFSIGDVVVCREALGEDGVSHLYLPQGTSTVECDRELTKQWEEYSRERDPSHRRFHSVKSWSFPALYRQSKRDLVRVTGLGCQVVEMEAAAVNAICWEKGAQTLSIFVVSDSSAGGEWKPGFTDPIVKDTLKQLFDQVIAFSAKEASLSQQR